MAPPDGKPVAAEDLVYHFQPSSDDWLTCILCGRDKCDLESTAYQRTPGGFYGRVTVGKHSTCTRKGIGQK